MKHNVAGRLARSIVECTLGGSFTLCPILVCDMPDFIAVLEPRTRMCFALTTKHSETLRDGTSNGISLSAVTGGDGRIEPITNQPLVLQPAYIFSIRIMDRKRVTGRAQRQEGYIN